MEAIAGNLARTRERLAAACAAAGRPAESVRLLAVSKTHGPEAIRAAVAAGQLLFGENRVQEAAAKIPGCPANLQWHLVGHLQSNKAASAARLFDWVHSVDSIKVLELLDRHAGEAGRRLNVLVQVNVSGEGHKSGAAPEELPTLLERGNALTHLQVRGLMTMPPLSADPEKARPFFRALRELRDRWADEMGMDLDELSMGMTHDLEVAVGEGATFVRVGTGIFGER
jgi:pyridoxal phosphate enzyme (YggS family)